MSALLVPTTIMWWLSCATVLATAQSPRIAEARDEGVDDRAGAAMPLDQRDLADVLARSMPTTPVGDRAACASSARVGAWFSTTPMTRALTVVRAVRCGDVEIRGREAAARPCTVPRAEAG